MNIDKNEVQQATLSFSSRLFNSAGEPQLPPGTRTARTEPLSPLRKGIMPIKGKAEGLL